MHAKFVARTFTHAAFPGLRLAIPKHTVLAQVRQFQPDAVLAINPVLMAATAIPVARRLHLPTLAVFCTNIPA